MGRQRLVDQWRRLTTETPTGADTHQAGGLTARIVAYLVDRIIINTATAAATITLAWDTVQRWADQLLAAGAETMSFHELVDAATTVIDAGEVAEIVAITALTFIFTSAAYTIPSHAIWGRTPGKKLCGLGVVHADGRPAGPKGGVGWWTALRRWATPAVTVAAGGYSIIATGAIYGWALTNPHRRGLHDITANTWVVQHQTQTPPTPATSEDGPGRHTTNTR